MKCFNKLEARVKELGGEFSFDPNEDYEVYMTAPKGYVWSATGSCNLIGHGATNRQTWWAQCAKELQEQASYGLRLASEDERAEVCWNNDFPDDGWDAPEGAAEKIKW
jgi:hypothetical protein